MCGFAGVVTFARGGARLDAVDRAAARLAHRGPDGAGRYAESEGSAWCERAGARRTLSAQGTAFSAEVTIAHRRLAIIDLSDAGAQPMVSADDRWLLAWNGELYNHVELRAELLQAGVVVRAGSDSAVLLAAWQRWGPRALDRFVGMFALAVIDRQAGTLWLARDPFGQKPLYTVRTADGLAFASELPALLELAGVRSRVEPASLAAFLAAGLTDRGGATMFSGLEALPPAHLLAMDLRRAGAPRLERYWASSLALHDDRPTASLAEELRAMLEESVRWHLRSDVPVGVMLSGGTDSSSITALARGVIGDGHPLHTFSYRPDGEALSEGPWIDVMNESTRAIAHAVRPSLAEFEAAYEPLVARQGEPFASPAILVQSMICAAAAASGVKVLLDGQGSDELLGGYASSRAARLAGHLRRLEVVSAWKFARSTAAAGHPRDGRAAAALLGARAIARWRARRGASPYGALTDAAWMRARGVAPFSPWAPEGPQVLREMQRHGTEEASVPALMRYADRNAMAASIEGRHPFLTTRIAEFALRLPGTALVGDDGSSKPLLRRAMRGLVPDAILDRRDKVGFAVPWRPWLEDSGRLRALLDAGARLPGVDARSAARLSLAVRARLPLSNAEVSAAWRIASVAAWAAAYDVAFD